MFYYVLLQIVLLLLLLLLLSACPKAGHLVDETTVKGKGLLLQYRANVHCNILFTCIAYLHLQTDTLNAMHRCIATYCTCVQMFTHCTHLCACSFLPWSVCRGQSVLFCTAPIHCTDELYLHSWSANSTECQHTSTTAGQSATNTQQRKNSPSSENVYDPLNNFQSTPFLTSLCLQNTAIAPSPLGS